MALFEQGDRTISAVEGLAAPRTAPKLHPQRRMTAGVCAALVLACIAIYGQTLSHNFVNLDDTLYVTENEHVMAGLNLNSIGWAFVTDAAHYFHPLTWMSHMLDCTLYGLHPWGHHLTNLIVHTAASVLLFLVLTFLTGRFWPSAAVAALFAVHPLHVESVAWIAERKDVLSAFFWMVALGAYGLYARRGGVLRYAAVLAAFVLGLMSKPMVVTLPFVLLLLDCWPLGRVDFDAPFPVAARKAGWLAVEKIPLLLISALSCASTLAMQANIINRVQSGSFTFPVRCANAVVVYVLYLVKAVWPSGLAVFYAHPTARPMWQVAGATLILAAITLFCLRRYRRHPYLIVGWLWYLGTLVPVIELVQACDFSHADRYTYIPLIGIFTMVAWGVADLVATRRVSRSTAAVASGLVLVLLTLCARVQAGYWHDSETLFRHAIAVGQESSIAFNNLGTIAIKQKRYDDARACLMKALELDPESIDALYNMGTLGIAQGKYDEAAAYTKRALALNPADVKALNNLAVCLIYQGRYEEARVQLQEALTIDPRHIPALENLGGVLGQLGRAEEAKGYLNRAAELKRARATERE